jgi:cardiolipin synthase
MPVDCSHTLPIQVGSVGPDSRWNAILKSYIMLVTLARDHVYRQSPFLILNDSVADIMKAAARAGIKGSFLPLRHVATLFS